MQRYKKIGVILLLALSISCKLFAPSAVPPSISQPTPTPDTQSPQAVTATSLNAGGPYVIFAGAAGCASSPGDGTFLLLPGQTAPVKLLDKKTYEVHWLPESKVFQAYPEALFSADGTKKYDPPVYDKSFEPAISMKGYQAWEVIENQQGRVVVKTSAEDWKTIINGMVDQLIWDPINGNTLFIAARDGSLYAASFPDFTPHMMGKAGSINQAIWLP